MYRFYLWNPLSKPKPTRVRRFSYTTEARATLLPSQCESLANTGHVV